MPQLTHRPREANHAPVRGKGTNVNVYLLGVGDHQTPTYEELAVGAAGAAKLATSIPLDSALGYKIEAGQYLTFIDANGLEYLAQLSATAAAGANSLTVEPLAVAVPGGATTESPAYLWDRTDASVSSSFNEQTVNAFNDGDNEDGVTTGFSRTMTLPGRYHFANAAYQTLLWAAERGRECWVSREFPAPNSNYQSGLIYEGPCGVTATESASGADGFVSADATVKWRGAMTITEPQPTA
ncbi:MAG: hypothetical protein ACFB0C_19520 [Leptolyngbyaceae cyanobacterium]